MPNWEVGFADSEVGYLDQLSRIMEVIIIKEILNTDLLHFNVIL